MVDHLLNIVVNSDRRQNQLFIWHNILLFYLRRIYSELIRETSRNDFFGRLQLVPVCHDIKLVLKNLLLNLINTFHDLCHWQRFINLNHVIIIEIYVHLKLLIVTRDTSDQGILAAYFLEAEVFELETCSLNLVMGLVMGSRGVLIN